MTEYEKLLRAIQAETSPTIALLLRRALLAEAKDPFVIGDFGGAPGALTLRRLLEAHGIDVSRLDQEKREGGG